MPRFATIHLLVLTLLTCMLCGLLMDVPPLGIPMLAESAVEVLLRTCKLTAVVLAGVAVRSIWRGL